MATDEHYLKRELDERAKTDGDVLHFLQSGILDGLWYWDLEKPEHEWMSPEFWRLLGFEPDEKQHLVSEWQELIYPEDLQLATENFLRHCDDPDHPYDQVVRYRHRDGSTVWVRCRGLAIRRDGKPVRLLGAHIDVTSLQEATSRLAELTERQEVELLQIKEALARERATLELWSREGGGCEHIPEGGSCPVLSAPVSRLRDSEEQIRSIEEQYRRLFAKSLSPDRSSRHHEARGLARRIGEAGGGPGDVLQLHLDLSLRADHLLPPQGQQLRERGRVFALEVMGHLTEYYRSQLARVDCGKAV